MSNVGIYTITSPTNRIYIGQSVNIRHRVVCHRNAKESSLIARSIKKYGWNSHQFNVILELKEDITQAQLDYWEQFFIDYYRNEGIELLNLKEAGSRGRHSEETKAKMSDAKKGWYGVGKKLSPETIEKIRIGNIGKKCTEEQKNRMSLAQTGLKKSETYKKNLSLRMKGKKYHCMPHSEETKLKISNFHKGKKHSIEHKEKIRLAHNKRLPHKKVHSSKLNINQVRIIFHCLNFGMKQKYLGDIFNVHQATISDINSGKRWSFVTNKIYNQWLP